VAGAVVAPVGNLTAGGGLPSTEALVLVAKTRAGLPSSLMGDGSKVDIPAAGTESPCVAPCCNLGRAADTNFVTSDIKEGLRDGAPTNRWTLLGTVGVSVGNPAWGVRTASGDLRAGTGQGVLGRGETGNAATLGAAQTGLCPVGGAATAAAAGRVELPVLAGGGGSGRGGVWPEMMSTWLPGARPCGGTTNRALLRRICVPAARWELVLMTILC